MILNHRITPGEIRIPKQKFIIFTMNMGTIDLHLIVYDKSNLVVNSS